MLLAAISDSHVREISKKVIFPLSQALGSCEPSASALLRSQLNFTSGARSKYRRISKLSRTGPVLPQGVTIIMKELRLEARLNFNKAEALSLIRSILLNSYRDCSSFDKGLRIEDWFLIRSILIITENHYYLSPGMNNLAKKIRC